MFEQLIHDAASRFNVSAAGASAIIRGILAMMANERTGGPEGFIDLFRRAGMGGVVTSWFGGNEGRTITAPEVESVLGASALERLASTSGLPRATVSSVAAFLLPGVIGRLTPNGVLPSSTALLSQVPNHIDRPIERATIGRAEPGVEPRHDRAGWPRRLVPRASTQMRSSRR